MAKILKLKFKDAKNKSKFISIAHPKENLDEATVKGAMQKISGADIFEKENVKMYVKPVAAYYTTTTEDSIFADSDEEANAE